MDLILVILIMNIYFSLDNNNLIDIYGININYNLIYKG